MDCIKGHEAILFITNAVAFGVISVLCAICIKALQNVETIVAYPWRAVLGVVIPLFICMFAGFGAQLNMMRKLRLLKGDKGGRS